MKIIVIGGTGLIGSKVVKKLSDQGHQAIAAVPATGVNALTGEGLADALTGADVVVDLANSPAFDDKSAIDFFTTAGKNIAAAEQAAGVKHHIALSVVGTEKLQDSGYFRGKFAQEELIRGSGTQEALSEPSLYAAWKRLPSYVIYGSGDRNIPAATMRFMAERAHSRKTVAIENGSHALMVSHPAEVAALIEDAATSK